jgi:hypothetical protein
VKVLRATDPLREMPGTRRAMLEESSVEARMVKAVTDVSSPRTAM